MGLSLEVVIIILLALSQTLRSKCCMREEKEALVNINSYFHSYNSSFHQLDILEFDSWISDSNNTDCCKWEGISCNINNALPSLPRISVISLHLFEISRMILGPGNLFMDFSFFTNFTHLTTLNISSQSQNHISTLIHTQALGNLSNLRVLQLKFNNLFPPLPTQFLGDLRNLEVLVLNMNNMGGTLPSKELCRLKKLRVLDLSYSSFEGSFPDCLTNLTSLKVLDLSNNNLTGEIPISVIASLKSLQHLSLMHNNFQGLFPLRSLANLSKLKVLALEMNTEMFQVDTEAEAEGVPWVPLFQLKALYMAKCIANMPTRTFPSFLLYQYDLQYLDLSYNNLIDVFPFWLLSNNTNLTSLILQNNLLIGPFKLPTYYIHQSPHPLIRLELSDNQMEGELPEDIGEIFPKLEYLNVSGNRFNGGIPRSVGNMSNLHALDLSNNNFGGEVPMSLWTGCAYLTSLILSHNQLVGQPFPSALSLSSLTRLSMDNNNLNGTLNPKIWELPSMTIFEIHNNDFSGMVPGFLSNSTNLLVINLSGNNFEGGLPEEFCKIELLIALQISHNKLSGSIPACYLNFPLLYFLHLQSNSLVGSIPNMKDPTDSTLLILDLRDNNLSGAIPNSIYWIQSLRALLLGGNHLHGELSNSLCQLREISFFDLSRNNFTGYIPACLNLSFGEYYTFYNFGYKIIYYNSTEYGQLVRVLAGEEEVEFRTKDSLLSYSSNILRFMSGMDLSCNHLTGEIPHQMGSLASLHALNLSHNHLNGSIPESFHKLQKIESLDLSYNNLNGKIPTQLQDLNFLEVFNVSYNNLSGTVPSNGQFGAFDESSFIGNPYLSWNKINKGITSPLPPPPNPNNDTKEDEYVIDFTSFIWSFMASYVMVLLILLVVLWINPHWRRLWFYFIETCLYRCFNPYLNDAFY